MHFEPNKVPGCRVSAARDNILSAWARRARAREKADAAWEPMAHGASTEAMEEVLARAREGLVALHSPAPLVTPELLTGHLTSVGSPLHRRETGALR